MIPFFIFEIWYWPTNEFIQFSKPDGSNTPVVILDDGWSPAVTTYVQGGEKTWSDVTEEIECMTNVATRDEALALLEKINALIHRAARDVEERKEYTLIFTVRSQFSTSENVHTAIISPPDDGNVVTLSTDIQTAPPGQIRFKLRFKRVGAWISSYTYYNKQFYLTSSNYNYKGLWVGSTTLPTPIQIPTPISTRLFTTPSNNGWCIVENLFLCINVEQHYIIKFLTAPPSFNMTWINYPASMLAQDNGGYLIQSNAVYTSYLPGPYSTVYLPTGTYAIFVSWRSVQPNVPHALKLRFSALEETSYALLFSKDTFPKLTFFGTTTLRAPSVRQYLLTKIGHSTGFEFEKIVFVRLKTTSSILQLKGLLNEFRQEPYESIFIRNLVLEPTKNVGITFANAPNIIKTQLYTYDSLNIVADNQNISFAVLGHSPQVFSLRTEYFSNFAHMDTWDARIEYRSIRTTIQ